MQPPLKMAAEQVAALRSPVASHRFAASPPGGGTVEIEMDDELRREPEERGSALREADEP